MKIFLVEDKHEVYGHFVTELEGTQIEIMHAENAANALEMLKHKEFDLAICDLKLPASASLPEARTEHGLHVFDQIRADRPGIPIIIYSAFGQLHDLGDRLSSAPQHDLFGDGPIVHVTHRSKNDPKRVITELKELAAKLQELHEIEISPASARDFLDHYARRLLRIYAKKRKGVLIKVKRLAGGRSGAVTVRAEIETPEAPLGGAIVAKIADHDSIADEENRFKEFIGPLEASTYTGLLESVMAGAGDRAALFYALANKYDRSLFVVLEQDVSEAAGVVRTLRKMTVPWHDESVSDESVSLGDIRNHLLSDLRLAGLETPDQELIRKTDEAQQVHVHWATGHGDLHGGNVLVDGEGTPILIDFGRLDRMTSGLDPITLELATVLHPDSKVELGDWPSAEQARRWSDLELYLEGCPIAEFIRATREWTLGVIRGDREQDATLYSYAVRQLRFPESVDGALAREFAGGAVSRLAAQE